MWSSETELNLNSLLEQNPRLADYSNKAGRLGMLRFATAEIGRKSILN
jgi:hypothetical protein